MTEKLAHGSRIEWEGPELEIHDVLYPGYRFVHLGYELIKRCLVSKDSFIIVTGHERGSGKTTWAQHYIRAILYPLLYEYGLTGNGGQWDWEEWTVCFDPGEFKRKYLMEVDSWQVVHDDEAIKNLHRRKAMVGRQKEDVEFLIVGRFLKKLTFACSTNVMRIDTAVLEDVATHWVHIVKSDRFGAMIKIRRRCPYYTEPSKTIFWDCMAHLRYPYTFPYDDLMAFKAFKARKWDDWMTMQAEIETKKKAKIRSSTVSKRDSRGNRKEDRTDNIAALESSHTTIPLLMNRQKDETEL